MSRLKDSGNKSKDIIIKIITFENNLFKNHLCWKLKDARAICQLFLFSANTYKWSEVIGSEQENLFSSIKGEVWYSRKWLYVFLKYLEELQKGGSILKPGILGNCVFARFSKDIKHLIFAWCQSEIPINSSRIRMNRNYCYQIVDDVLGRC